MLKAYLEHYLSMPYNLIFFGVTILFVFLCFFILCIYAKARMNKDDDGEEIEFYSLSDRFCEIVFSGTSILFFVAVYYLIEQHLYVEPYMEIWDKYNDLLLLVLVIFSCVLNNILDRFFVPLQCVKKEIASIRLLGMLYMICIFLYIKIPYQDSNYDSYILYFLGLMIGRFAYFDASFEDFKKNIKRAAQSIPLMIMGLSLTGILCLYGYKVKNMVFQGEAVGYLLRPNGVIVNIFFAHCLMCMAVFIIYRFGIIKILNKMASPAER